MITPIKTYIEQCVAIVDSGLKLIDDPTGTIDYSQKNEIGDGYKIIFDSSTTTKDGNFFIRSFPVRIEITKKGYRDLYEDFDAVFNKALSIEGEVISPARISSQDTFSQITTSGVAPEPFDENLKTFKMTINVAFEAYYDCD